MVCRQRKQSMKIILALLLFTSSIAFAENSNETQVIVDDIKLSDINKKIETLSLNTNPKKSISKKNKLKHCSQHSLKTLRKKSKPYNQAITEASSQYGISAALIRSIITTESCFKPTIISPQGATGLMQLMPATAKRFGIIDLTNPTNNIQAGTRYLRYLLDRYQGNVVSTIAAYNAGEGAVKRFKGEVPAYKETKTYVKRVMSLYDKFFHAYQKNQQTIE